jgi:serine/threonine-protein phosphatase 2B catalytic subunit
MDEDPKASRLADNKQVDNALRAINEKKPVPEIDFTLHTMEDGSTVSTMERVCKGNGASAYLPISIPSSSSRRI